MLLKRIVEDGTFKEVFVDINLRKPYNQRSVIEFACRNATIIKISNEELQEDDIPKALDFAARLSAYVVSCIEAIPDYKVETFE